MALSFGPVWQHHMLNLIVALEIGRIGFEGYIQFAVTTGIDSVSETIQQSYCFTGDNHLAFG